MKKLFVLTLALTAAFALTAIVATSAFAADEWLIKGNPIAAGKEEPAEMSGEILVEDMNALIGADITCSVVLESTLLPGGVALVLKILMLNKVQFLDLDLEKKEFQAVDCLFGAKGACEELNATLLGLISLALGWTMDILLFGATFVGSITEGAAGKEPGYEASCFVLAVEVTDICRSTKAAPPGADLTNVAGGVEATFSANEERNPASNCTIGGAKKGLLEGKLLVTSTAGQVTVS